MHTHVTWLSFSRLISIMFCELPLTYFHRLPERKLLSGGVSIARLCSFSILLALKPHLTRPLPYCRVYASSNRVSIGSNNGLVPIRRQAVIWTNAGLFSIRSLGAITCCGLRVLIHIFMISKDASVNAFPWRISTYLDHNFDVLLFGEQRWRDRKLHVWKENVFRKLIVWIKTKFHWI